MTEQDATQKWCPFARVALISYVDADSISGMASINRETAIPEISKQCNCIASQCMAWRPIYESGNGHGYCGLAGRPDSDENKTVHQAVFSKDTKHLWWPPDPAREAEYRRVWIECAMRVFTMPTPNEPEGYPANRSFATADVFLAELRKRDAK